MNATVISFFVLLFFMTHTPGPNNVIMLRTGLMFGYHKTLPYILGVVAGSGTLFTVLNLGLAQVFRAYPVLVAILKVLGSVYLMYLSYAIIKSSFSMSDNFKNLSDFNSEESEVRHRSAKQIQPFTFMQSFMFQFVNAKAYVAMASAFTLLAEEPRTLRLFLIAEIACVVVMITSTHLWTLGGVFLKRFLKNRAWMLTANIILALFLLWMVIRFWLPDSV